MTPEEFREKAKKGEVQKALGLGTDSAPEESELQTDSVDRLIKAVENANGKSKKSSPDAPKWLVEGVQKIENKTGVPAMISKRLEAYLLKNNFLQADINKMTPEQAMRMAGEIAGIIEKGDGKIRQTQEEEISRVSKETELNLSDKDRGYLYNSLKSWSGGRRIRRTDKEFSDILIKAGLNPDKLEMDEWVKEAKKIIDWKDKTKNPRKEKKQELEKPAVEEIPFYKRRIEIADRVIDSLMEQLSKAKLSEGVAGLQGKIFMEQAAKKTIEAKLKIAEELAKKEIKPEVAVADSRRRQKVVNNAEAQTDEERARDIRAKIQEVEIKIEDKKVNPMEEIDKKIAMFRSDTRDSYGRINDRLARERIINFYLNELGWEVKYGFLHWRAYIVDKNTKEFIGKNGEPAKDNKERKQVYAYWEADKPRKDGEENIEVFLRTQLERKKGVSAQLEGETRIFKGI